MKTSQILLEAANLLFERKHPFSCTTIRALPDYWKEVRVRPPSNKETHKALKYYTDIYCPDSAFPFSAIWARDTGGARRGWPNEETEEGINTRAIALLLAREIALSEGL